MIPNEKISYQYELLRVVEECHDDIVSGKSKIEHYHARSSLSAWRISIIHVRCTKSTIPSNSISPRSNLGLASCQNHCDKSMILMIHEFFQLIHIYYKDLVHNKLFEDRAHLNKFSYQSVACFPLDWLSFKAFCAFLLTCFV